MRAARSPQSRSTVRFTARNGRRVSADGTARRPRTLFSPSRDRATQHIVGISRPQEKSSNKLARQVIEDAGPGEPGKQAPDFRLRRSEDGLPDIGAPSGQRPDPNARVADQSLSKKLLDYQSSGEGTAPVEKRETTPLKDVY